MKTILFALLIFIASPAHADRFIAACSPLRDFAEEAALSRYAGATLQEHLDVVNEVRTDKHGRWIMKNVVLGAHKLGNLQSNGHIVAESREYADKVYKNCLYRLRVGKMWEW